ncbi:MAG: hypothetical protein FWE82_07070, partial [Defluviitaleaceae bacterium]|nr:hypothetical protein [Defluviitaleaceae bacterium]
METIQANKNAGAADLPRNREENEKNKIDLKNFGFSGTEFFEAGFIPGRVTEQRREQYAVMTEAGELTALLKGAFVNE